MLTTEDPAHTDVGIARQRRIAELEAEMFENVRSTVERSIVSGNADSVVLEIAEDGGGGNLL